jgi:hypothetical protein
MEDSTVVGIVVVEGIPEIQAEIGVYCLETGISGAFDG